MACGILSIRMSAAETIVVGRSSLLAREFAARHSDIVLRVLGHAEADDAAAYEGARCVVNFAFAPGLERLPYDAALDIDQRIGARAAQRGSHYVMISSRRVYARDAQWNAQESMPAPGMDLYGSNKTRVERGLHEALGDRLTILRPGNVLAHEPVAGRRRFGAYLQHQLVTTGRIRLTVDPAARRDLIPAEFFCRAVREAAVRRLPGVFNVGSGRATATGDAAHWLLLGFGAGELHSEASQPADEFQLDCVRLRQAFGLACAEGAVERTLREIGRRLASGG
jgi:dTDP-4-dehydrorhamnose reductase/UDP-glucose 4-epimerase